MNDKATRLDSFQCSRDVLRGFKAAPCASYPYTITERVTRGEHKSCAVRSALQLFHVVKKRIENRFYGCINGIVNGHLPYQRTKILKESARTSQRAASAMRQCLSTSA